MVRERRKRKEEEIFTMNGIECQCGGARRVRLNRGWRKRLIADIAAGRERELRVTRSRLEEAGPSVAPHAPCRATPESPISTRLHPFSAPLPSTAPQMSPGFPLPSLATAAAQCFSPARPACTRSTGAAHRTSSSPQPRCGHRANTTRASASKQAIGAPSNARPRPRTAPRA